MVTRAIAEGRRLCSAMSCALGVLRGGSSALVIWSQDKERHMDLLGLFGLIVLSMGAFALGYMLPDLIWALI